MQLRMLSQPAQPPEGAAPALAALRRRQAALLRWRVRWLGAVATHHHARAARLLPVLLHASFERPRLRDEAPGVAGLRYRRGWATLAREFDLPPPFKTQRGTPLVEAVVALPERGGLAVLVVAAAGLRAADQAWVADRCAAAGAVAAAAGVRLEPRVLAAADLARHPELAARLAVHGALLGGRFSAATWGALEATARRPVEPRLLAALAADSTSPLAALALTLLSSAPAPAPLEATARLLAEGVPALALADPDELCARWAAGRPDLRDDLLATLGACRPSPGAVELGATDLLALAGRLGLASARAIRAAHGGRRDRAATAAWREVVGAGVPRALLPALGRQLAAAGPLRTALTRAGGGHEVHLPGGTVLGRGSTPVQARVRALSVLASAALDSVLEHAEPPWRALAGRLAQRRERPTLLLVVEPAIPSGPPFDPLNRGPQRALGFPGALELRLGPGRRPVGRVLTGDEAVDRLVREVVAGAAVEVIPSRSEAHPVAARLTQLAALVRDVPGQVPVALEAGGRVLLPRPGRPRHFPLDRFLARPRTFVPDPDAPDLALAPGERRPVGLRAAGLVECRASLLDEARAAILYTDAAQGWFRETVFLAELEEHLRDARSLLLQASAGAMLAVRLSDGVEPALRRTGRPGAPVAVAVRGQLPHDLQVEVGGERYGGTTGAEGWRSAARAVLARWPRGGEGRLSVNSVTIQAGGRRGAGLLALYARSVALRRLRFFLVQELRALSAGQDVPKGQVRATRPFAPPDH